MESIINHRKELIAIIEDVKANNQRDTCLNGLLILQKLISNIIENPCELKYRVIKKNNNAIKTTLLNVNKINDLLTYIGYIELIDHYEINDDSLEICEVFSGVIIPAIQEIQMKINEREAGKSLKQNPEVAKELAKVEKKRKEEKDAKDQIKKLLEKDKQERMKRNNNNPK